MNATYFTFVIYLIGLLVIGVITYRMSNTLSEYILGGRKLNGWVTAFSAQASDFSGWLLLGLPGAAYASGMGQWSIWISVGLAIGATVNWSFVAKRLRKYTEVSGDSITLSEYFENRFRDKSHILRVISATFTLIFFMFYTAAGLVGGGVLFQSTFGIDFTMAVLVGAIIIIVYTFLGGFLAVCWTDFVQGVLMFVALLITPIVAIYQLGGFDALFTKMGQINVNLLDITTGVSYDPGSNVLWESAGGIGVVGIASALAWGLGYFGQPHILARFMAIRSTKEIGKARLIAVISGVVLPLYGAIFVGMAGIAFFGTDNPLMNSEIVYIELVQVVFNPWIAGFLLAAILAAIMSTIDSQLLVSSSALTEDFYKTFFRKNASDKELVWVSRLSVVVIAVIAILLAMSGGKILDLVAYAWAGFGAAFGPAVILSLFWKRMTRNGALSGIIVGGLTVILWEYTGSALYEMVPGFIFSAIAIIIFSLLDKEPSKEIQDEFELVNNN
jgi:sodium/proline symporter